MAHYKNMEEIVKIDDAMNLKDLSYLNTWYTASNMLILEQKIINPSETLFYLSWAV